MLCDNCTYLNYVKLVHSSFQAYYIFFCFLPIHSIVFLEFCIETPTKNLNLPTLKGIIEKYSGIIDTFVLYFPSLLKMYYHTFVI